MREKIVEILVYLMGELRNNTPLNEIDLSVLTNNGYTPTEIGSAFSWIYENMEGDENPAVRTADRSPHSHRVLHEAERSVITPEGFGYLLQMRELGLLDDAGIESVIDRVFLGGYATAGEQEIKSLVASLLLEPGNERGEHRTIVNGKDKIH